MNETTKIKVYRLTWGGNMKRTTVVVSAFPKEVLKVDDWFSPQIGELCFNDDGEIDVVKDIKYVRPKDPFQGYNKYILESGKTNNESFIIRLEVKRGRVFIFNGKPFVHQEALDGGYKDKIAQGKKIKEYEYEFGK